MKDDAMADKAKADKEKQYIQPWDIEYQPFTDRQIVSFADAAGIAYSSSNSCWRNDLNEAARDYLFDCFAKRWPTPSKMLKELGSIIKNPDKFLGRLAEIKTQPVAIAILHGTGWHPDRLDDAAGCRDEFLAGVNREIEFLTRIVARRKDGGMTGNGGNPEFSLLIERLEWVFTKAFGEEVNYGLNGSAHSGPFIGFAKSVVLALKDRLSKKLEKTDLPVQLGVFCGDNNTAIWIFFCGRTAIVWR